jgi:hypothetical protein
MVHNIGLIGKARSGKDSAALHLVRTRQYTRLAFADPLKEMALSINPYIPTGYGVTVRLSALIADVGWEYAKDTYPEVRRFLQRLGQSIRDQDEDYFANMLRRKLNNAEAWNLPVVVADVRYPNEAEMLAARGFRMVRIVRPTGTAMTMREMQAAMHDSENALNDYEADLTITNDGTLDDLARKLGEQLL